MGAARQGVVDAVRAAPLSLLELGEDLEAAERQLLRWRFHPALARQSVEWAVQRHDEARSAATDR